MPRGEKSKLHARQKHLQARGEAQACASAQKSAEGTPEIVEKSSAASHTHPGPESFSTPKGPQKITSTVSTILSFSFSESDGNSCEESDEFKANPCTIHLHQDLIARKVMELVECLLHNYNLKKYTTKEEMLKLLNKKYENHFPEILRKASQKLEDAFVVEVREVNSSEHSYNLNIKMKLPNNGRIRPGKGFPKTGFLMYVLGIILTRGTCASEEDIWKILKTKQIYPGKKHRVFGEPRKLMTQYLVKLNYLEYRQVADSDPPRYEFLWGPQAHAETSKTKVLEYWAKMNPTKPSSMSVHSEVAVKDDPEQAEGRDEDDSGATYQSREDSQVKFPGNSNIPVDP